MGGLVRRLETWREDGAEVLLVSHTQGQAQRLLKLLEPYPLNLDFRGKGFDQSNLTSEPTPGIRLYVGELSCGFRMEEAGRIVVTEEEIFGSRVRSAHRKRAAGTLLSSLTDLVEGEPVVHEDYGIGIFRGLAKKEFEGVSREVMVIEYAGGDLLYQPLERLQTIQKFVSGSDAPPRIDRLGGKGWEKTKAKVKKSIREMAKQLLEIYARRSISSRKAYSPLDETYAEFEASFEFEETPDQNKAIQDVLTSMDSDVPMDRLVCGDVGFGKTEVALRAAFRAVMDGKQAAILVPTTVLAQQHYDTCLRRFRNYPITVEMLSRFRSPSHQKEILDRVKAGKVDLVVGTHRLLQKDVTFSELGLLVVDEEHRFGVTHKEKIKKYRAHVDVLTLTATPIPRTLNLSLSGIRDLSLIETPPTNRRSIRTHVMKQSDEVIRDALLREITRGGQAFYIHNRVKTIYKRAAALQELVPEGQFAVAHGQMGAKDLERVMLHFVRGKSNVLVCTSIIESGLDIPRVNTILIERADAFGLADLYQLRGRVGRSSVRAYCYLLTPPETLMTPDAIKRMAVIQEHSSLGQGFRIAMRDLEIRGAGNILGTAQSGHVGLVGYEMYLDLLGQTVAEMKGEQLPPKIDPEIAMKIEAVIPEEYVPDSRQRMSLYKRLSRAETSREIDQLEDEIIDLYGKPPLETSNLVRLMRVRLLMKEVRITRLDYNGEDLVLSFHSETPVDPDLMISWVQQSPNRVRILPGDRVLYRIGKTDAETRIRQAFELLERFRHHGASLQAGPSDGDVGWIAASKGAGILSQR
jgi:transcription-repair coupling factor (superfamily II helicase)